MTRFILFFVALSSVNLCRSQQVDKRPVLAMNSLEFQDIFDTPVGLSIEDGRFFMQCTRYGVEVTLNVTAESRQRPGEFFYPAAEIKLEPDVVKFWVKIDDLASADADYFCQNVEEKGRRGESSAERVVLGYKLCGFGSQECQNSPPCKPGTYCVKRTHSSKGVEYCLRGTDFEDRCQQTIPPKEDVLYVACKGARGTTICHHQVHGLVSSLEHGTFCADETDNYPLITIGNSKTTTGDVLRLEHHTPISVSINCSVKTRHESKTGTQLGAFCDLKFEDDPVKSFSFEALDCAKPKASSFQVEAAKRFDPLNFAFAKLECRWTRSLPPPEPNEPDLAASRFTYRYITYMSGKAEIRFSRKKICDTGAGVPLDCNLTTPLSPKSPFMVTEIRISRYGEEKLRQKNSRTATIKVKEPGVYSCNLTVRFRICSPFFEYSQVFLAPNKITVAVAERCLPLDGPSARYSTTTEDVGETAAAAAALSNETDATILKSFLQDATKIQWLMVGGGGIACVLIIVVFVAVLVKSRNKRKKVVKLPSSKIQSRYSTQRNVSKMDSKKMSSKMDSQKMSSKMDSKMKGLSRSPTKKGRTYFAPPY